MGYLFHGKQFAFRAVKQEIVLGVTVDKNDGSKPTYHPTAYFKRNNGEIIMDHLEEFLALQESKGYTTTKHLQEQEESIA